MAFELYRHVSLQSMNGGLTIIGYSACAIPSASGLIEEGRGL